MGGDFGGLPGTSDLLLISVASTTGPDVSGHRWEGRPAVDGVGDRRRVVWGGYGSGLRWVRDGETDLVRTSRAGQHK